MFSLKRQSQLPPVVNSELRDLSTAATAWGEQAHDDSGNNLDGVPVGAVVDWPLTAPPLRWLLCNGQAVSRAKYAALFKRIGVTQGVGDGSTTFNVPTQAGVVGDYLIIYAGV